MKAATNKYFSLKIIMVVKAVSDAKAQNLATSKLNAHHTRIRPASMDDHSHMIVADIRIEAISRQEAKATVKNRLNEWLLESQNPPFPDGSLVWWNWH